MATLIERDASEAIAQHDRDAVPGVRVNSTAVLKEDWRARAAPIEVMKPRRADDHLMVVR
jgi:hypothetical protein